MKIDWSAGDFALGGPGLHLVTVEAAEEKRSKGGDAYFNLRLSTSTFEGKTATLCFDILMVQGGGAGIGLAKLKALGFDSAREVISPEDIVGRRAWVNVDVDEYEGKKRLKVVTEFNPFACGYWPETAPPDGVDTPIAPLGKDEDIPF